MLLGHHTLGIECKDVLSSGVNRMLVGNRVSVGLTRSTIRFFDPIQSSHHGSKENCPNLSEPPPAGTVHHGRILLTTPETSHKPIKSHVFGMGIKT